VTGKNTMGQCVGSTAVRVHELMSQAKGGILFIEGMRILCETRKASHVHITFAEAYGMQPDRGTFGSDAIQALMDNITSPEFFGNILVILAGLRR
jgi:hypothetical protein